MNNDNIIIGSPSSPDYDIGDESIRKITAVNGMDIVGAELSVDQLTLNVAGDTNDGKLIAPADYEETVSSDGFTLALREGFINLPSVPYGTEVRYLREQELFGLYYTKNIKRLSASLYQINAMSAIGLLDKQQHNGGIYTGQTFEAVAREIIGGTIAYRIDANVANVAVYGWLPVDTKRKNLHQLLFATGAALAKDDDGTVRFVFLSSGSPTIIQDGRIFLGGNVDYSSPATAVEITEHTYYAFSNDDTVTLFDNTDGSGAADNTFVTFSDAPVHNLVASGNLTVVSSGVNYAILTGTGTLTGKKYTHVTKTISKAAEGATGEENVITVTDATLVSVANSENVARRVMAYYSSKKTVSASVVLDREKAGDQISFHDPYGDKSNGFIAEMSVNVSSILKAECTVITDYTPQFQGNTYTQSQLLTGSGTFTVGANGAQVTLIGGGDGGQSGGNGYAGEDSRGYTDALIINDGGEGGVAGSAGFGGRVYTVVLPAGTYTYNCGSGGSGGVASGTSPTDGAIGTDTTISKGGIVIYSSANGSPSVNGVINVFDGTAYARPGEPGVNGGKGGKPTAVDSFHGYDAESVTFNGQTWEGGTNAGVSYRYRSDGQIRDTYYGGAGGGAAVGSRGNDGEQTVGGAGASGTARSNATMLGAGGDGGHGGGGGGAGGGSQDTYRTGWFDGASGGSGGQGGTGGRGGNGCILVYS